MVERVLNLRSTIVSGNVILVASLAAEFIDMTKEAGCFVCRTFSKANLTILYDFLYSGSKSIVALRRVPRLW